MFRVWGLGFDAWVRERRTEVGVKARVKVGVERGDGHRASDRVRRVRVAVQEPVALGVAPEGLPCIPPATRARVKSCCQLTASHCHGSARDGSRHDRRWWPYPLCLMPWRALTSALA